MIISTDKHDKDKRLLLNGEGDMLISRKNTGLLLSFDDFSRIDNLQYQGLYKTRKIKLLWKVIKWLYTK